MASLSIKKAKRGVRSSLLLVLAAGVGLAVSHGIERVRLAGGVAQAQEESQKRITTSEGLPDFVGLVKRVGPVVVNVSTTQMRKTAQGPFGDDGPSGEFWERFFGGRMPRGPQRQSGLGSGFIIDRDGTILTNYHVVDGAEKIVVTLSDGKTFDGRVLGRDQKTDIAIIKIDAKQDLPAARLGDSDRLEVGEWVMAIGNPFGLDHTVTTGIVSAKGRHIGSGPYEDFIQTDASINPGNSGGPLLNLRGEVIGINTAIFSQSGGNIGIGFAIPTNLVKELVPQLKTKGKVVRGYLGTTVQKITPEIAESMGLKPRQGGALVAEVLTATPAEKAGIKSGDVIVEFDGKEIKDSADLPLQVARIAPGKTVQMKIVRDNKELTLPITVGEIKEKEVAAASDNGDLGLAVQPITPEMAASLGLNGAEGLVITAIRPGSAAEDAGLQRGDVVAEVNRHPVRNLADYNREISKVEKGKSLLFLVRRGEGTLFLALKP